MHAMQKPPLYASMKVPPKRKGNFWLALGFLVGLHCLNESPSEKEGKLPPAIEASPPPRRLNESPSEKEGKSDATDGSMSSSSVSLNESPSEKEGKFSMRSAEALRASPQ